MKRREKAGGFKVSDCASFSVLESGSMNAGDEFQEVILPVERLILVSCEL